MTMQSAYRVGGIPSLFLFRTESRSFFVRAAAVFAATAVLDAVWAGYMSSVAAKDAVIAALWAAALFAVSACVTRAAAIASSNAGNSAASSGKSR